MTSRLQYDSKILLNILSYIEEKGFQPFEWEGTADNVFTVKYKDRSGKEYTGVYRVEDGNVVEVEPGK